MVGEAQASAGETTEPRERAALTRLAKGVAVGRSVERAALQDAVDEALAGRGRLFLLAGEAGIGKTTLAQEAVSYARKRGFRVFSLRPREADDAPAYWPWIRLLRQCLEDEDVAQLLSANPSALTGLIPIVPEVAARQAALPVPPAASPEEERLRLFDAVASFLRHVARDRPLFVLLEDLHWADQSSLLLLQYLTPEIADCRVGMVGCYRDVEIGVGHSAARIFATIRRERSCTHLVVRGLSEDDVRTQLAAIAGQNPPRRFVHTIYTRTEGNPFFVEEILRHLLDEGVLFYDGQRWTSRLAAEEMPLPAEVREAIERRLTHLSADCRAVLTIAAVIGREFEHDTLAALSHLSAEPLDAALSQAVAARVLARSLAPAQDFRFAHALIREVLYDGLPRVQRVELHRSVGEEIERRDRSEPQLAELAYHFCAAAEAGCYEKAIKYAIKAGRRADGLMAHEEASRLYQLALATIDSQHMRESEQLCDVLLLFCDSLWKAGEYDRARAIGLRAIDVARSLGEKERLARAVLGYSGQLTAFEAILTDDTEISLIEEALASTGDEDGTLAILLMSRLAEALSLVDAHERRWSLSRRAVEMARRQGDKQLLATVLLSAHWASRVTEPLVRRASVANEIIGISTEIGDRMLSFEGHVLRLYDFIELGDAAAARTELAICDHLAAALRQPYRLWVVACSRVFVAFMEGKLKSIQRLAEEALRLGNDAENKSAGMHFAVQVGLLFWFLGRLEEVEEMVKGSGELYPRAIHTIRCDLAAVYSEQGRVQEARVEFERLASNNFNDLPLRNTWSFSVAFLSETCAFLGDTLRAEQLYELLRPHARSNLVMAPMVTLGAAAHYLGLLAATLGRRQEASMHFESALEMNASMGTSHCLARTQVAYAQMLVTSGATLDLTRAGRLLDDARWIAQDLGMCRLIAKIHLLQDQLRNESVGTADPASAMQAGGPPAHESQASAVVPAHIDHGEGASSQENVCRREGEYWVIRYAGTGCILPHRKGLDYLAHLLRHPNWEIPAITLLAGAGNGGARLEALSTDLTSAAQGAGHVIDEQAVRQYREEIADLREELDEAERANDLGRAESLRQQIDVLVGHLGACMGLSGRRREFPSEGENARTAVTKGIRSAIGRIAAVHPGLARHLERHVTTGRRCCYRVDSPDRVCWQC